MQQKYFYTNHFLNVAMDAAVSGFLARPLVAFNLHGTYKGNKPCVHQILMDVYLVKWPTSNLAFLTLCGSINNALIIPSEISEQTQ